VARHPGRPERDVAFAGGIDLCHSRRDDAAYLGDPQPVSGHPSNDFGVADSSPWWLQP